MKGIRFCSESFTVTILEKILTMIPSEPMMLCCQMCQTHNLRKPHGTNGTADNHNGNVVSVREVPGFLELVQAE